MSAEMERRRDADRQRLRDAVAAGEMAPTKSRTLYFCPNDECGKSSLSTGDLAWNDGYWDLYSGRFCLCCGSELVEEVRDGRWRVSFESVSAVAHPEVYDWRTERAIPGLSIREDWWTPCSRETDSERSARDQYDGLLKLIEEGEYIRNPRLERATEPSWASVSEEEAKP